MRNDIQDILPATKMQYQDMLCAYDLMTRLTMEVPTEVVNVPTLPMSDIVQQGQKGQQKKGLTTTELMGRPAIIVIDTAKMEMTALSSLDDTPSIRVLYEPKARYSPRQEPPKRISLHFEEINDGDMINLPYDIRLRRVPRG